MRQTRRANVIKQTTALNMIAWSTLSKLPSGQNDGLQMRRFFCNRTFIPPTCKVQNRRERFSRRANVVAQVKHSRGRIWSWVTATKSNVRFIVFRKTYSRSIAFTMLFFLRYSEKQNAAARHRTTFRRFSENHRFRCSESATTLIAENVAGGQFT